MFWAWAASPFSSVIAPSVSRTSANGTKVNMRLDFRGGIKSNVSCIPHYSPQRNRFDGLHLTSSSPALSPHPEELARASVSKDEARNRHRGLMVLLAMREHRPETALRASSP